MSEWIYFSMHSPTHDDLPIVATGNGTGLGIWENTLPARWDNRWTAWRSIGPLPKSVDDGEKLVNEYVKGMGWARESYTQDDFQQVARIGFMAGYAAGKGK